jgi:hypothetical protein
MVLGILALVAVVVLQINQMNLNPERLSQSVNKAKASTTSVESPSIE